MNEADQSQSSTEASLTDLSKKISQLPEERRKRISELSKILIETHAETFKKLAEIEKKELEFELAMAEEIWMKVKGYPIPESYSVADRLGIFERYYHRAVAQSQGE